MPKSTTRRNERLERKHDKRTRVTGARDFLGLIKEFKHYSFDTGQTLNDLNQARDKLRFAHLKVPSVWRGERAQTGRPIKRPSQSSGERGSRRAEAGEKGQV